MNRKLLCLALMSGCAIALAEVGRARCGSAVDEATAAKLVGGGCVNWKKTTCSNPDDLTCDMADIYAQDPNGAYYGQGVNTHNCGGVDSACGGDAGGVSGCKG